MSDLREALSNLLNCVDGQHDPEWLQRRKDDARAALSAQPQPDAVEAVRMSDLIDERSIMDVMNGHLTVYKRHDDTFEIRGAKRAAQAILEIAAYNANNPHRRIGGDGYPPIAPDARMRRALEQIIDIPNRQFGPDWEEIEEAREIAREALRADEGKEFEGGRELTDQEQRCVEAALFASGTVVEELRPSEPTPPDKKPWPDGCRNPNSCSIHRDCMYLQCKHYERDISGEVDAALSTRAGG